MLIISLHFLDYFFLVYENKYIFIKGKYVIQNNLFWFFLVTKALYGLIFMLAGDASKVVVLGGIR